MTRDGSSKTAEYLLNPLWSIAQPLQVAGSQGKDGKYFLEGLFWGLATALVMNIWMAITCLVIFLNVSEAKAVIFILLLTLKEITVSSWSFFRHFQCHLAEYGLINENHEISSIFGTIRCNLLSDGCKNQKSVFCIFTAMVQPFRWCTIYIKSCSGFLKKLARPHFGDFALYYRLS